MSNDIEETKQSVSAQYATVSNFPCTRSHCSAGMQKVHGAIGFDIGCFKQGTVSQLHLSTPTQLLLIVAYIKSCNNGPQLPPNARFTLADPTPRLRPDAVGSGNVNGFPTRNRLSGPHQEIIGRSYCPMPPADQEPNMCNATVFYREL